MKEKTENGVEGNKMNRGEGWDNPGYWQAIASVCIYMSVYMRADDLGKQQQQQGTDVACCGCICICQPTIDKANVACYHTH